MTGLRLPAIKHGTAMKIRCQQCNKKISIDEAFAGGVCRCPYCKAITVVPADESAAPATARPGRPERPDSPMARPESPVARPESPAARPQSPSSAAPAGPTGPVSVQTDIVPVARRVMIQGVVTIVLSALMVLLIVAAAVGIYFISHAPDSDKNQTATTSPAPAHADEGFIQKEGQLAGQTVQTPLVIVVDCSTGMRDYFDPAAALVRYYVQTLKPQDKFEVVLATEKQPLRMSSGWCDGGPAADEKVARFFGKQTPGGKSDLRAAVLHALEFKPKTIAVFAAKPVDDPADLAKQAEAAGTKIVGYALGDGSDTAKAMKALGEGNGGACVPIMDPGSLLLNSPPLKQYQED